MACETPDSAVITHEFTLTGFIDTDGAAFIWDIEGEITPTQLMGQLLRVIHLIQLDLDAMEAEDEEDG